MYRFGPHAASSSEMLSLAQPMPLILTPNPYACQIYIRVIVFQQPQFISVPGHKRGEWRVPEAVQRRGITTSRSVVDDHITSVEQLLIPGRVTQRICSADIETVVTFCIDTNAAAGAISIAVYQNQYGRSSARPRIVAEVRPTGQTPSLSRKARRPLKLLIVSLLLSLRGYLLPVVTKVNTKRPTNQACCI